MSDTNTINQTQVSGFFYRKADLASSVLYLGDFGQNIIESLSKSKGSLNPVYASNPTRSGQIDIIDLRRGAPELGEMPFRERVHPFAANFLEQEFDIDCDAVVVIKLDSCGSKDTLQTFDRLFVVDELKLNNISIEGLMAYETDNPVDMTGGFSLKDWKSILPIRFSEVAADDVLAEIVDGLYYDEVSCGSCSVFSSGADKAAVLAVANTGSPGLSAQFVYTTDHWVTPNVADIPTLSGKTARRFTAAGTYFVVVSPEDAAHHYAPKSNPAASSWVRVSTGYSGAGYTPRCVYAKSASQVFFGAQDSRIYKATDITAGVEVVQSTSGGDLNDIHGSGQTVVAVGDSNTIWLSENSGESFVSVTGPDSGANLQSVHVISRYRWYVGTSNGELYWTGDQGTTWTRRQLPNQTTATEVLDIKFAPGFPEVGAIAVQDTTGAGHVYRTFTGGRTWASSSPGIANLPTNERINVVALAGVNEILAAGKRQGSTDGVVAVAR